MRPRTPYTHTAYTVIEASSVESLITAVNSAIAEGWAPVGGITLGLLNKLYQAMEKAESV